jgi:hypothetical protein
LTDLGGIKEGVVPSTANGNCRIHSLGTSYIQGLVAARSLVRSSLPSRTPQFRFIQNYQKPPDPLQASWSTWLGRFCPRSSIHLRRHGCFISGLVKRFTRPFQAYNYNIYSA